MTEEELQDFGRRYAARELYRLAERFDIIASAMDDKRAAVGVKCAAMLANKKAKELSK